MKPRGTLRVSLSAIYVLLLAEGIIGAKILIMCPTPNISHQFPFHYIARALLARGHEVTLMTADPTGINHENYTEIDSSCTYGPYRAQYDWSSAFDDPPTKTMLVYSEGAEIICDTILKETTIMDLARSGEKFDLVILELLSMQSLFGVWHAVGSPPLVGMITLTPPATIYTHYGNPMNPAYAPEMWLGYSDRMTFWERLYNTYFYLLLHHLWYYDAMPRQEALLRKYFGDVPVDIYETERNFSLLIVNNHFSLEYPRPHMPSIVEITGIHVETKNKPLPEKIQSFLDGADHGVVYVSLGSNVRSDSLPEERKRAFIEAFRELPQRVLWKWESDSLPDQPENVMVGKWLPQQDILAHPKVRMFITQGGLQSLNEATYHAVPLLAIPFFSDQAHNAEKITTAEVGLRLELRDTSKDTLLSRIRAILNEDKYRNNMRRFSAIFREHKESSTDTATRWIEYVIRHHGAPHLRSAAVDMSWWQLLLLDVVGFVLLAVAMATTAAYLLLRAALRAFSRSSQKIKKQ